MIERHELQGRVKEMDGTGNGMLFSHEISGRGVERGASVWEVVERICFGEVRWNEGSLVFVESKDRETTASDAVMNSTFTLNNTLYKAITSRPEV